jgi:hypothetical protein
VPRGGVEAVTFVELVVVELVVVGGVVVTAGVPVPFEIVAVRFCGVPLGSTGCVDTAGRGVSVARRVGMLAVNETDSVA